MESDVSIIILTKNGGNRLKDLLERVNNQNFPGIIEILAIDSGSHDETLKILNDFDVSITEIHPHEFHHSKTRNLGAEKSNGKFLVYLTQDALPYDENWLKNLLNPLLNKKNIGAVYGRQIANPDAKIMDKFFYDYFYPESTIEIKDSNIKNMKKFYLENIFISDVCSAIKKDIWEKIKFKDHVGMSEDKDFAFSALKKGYSIIYEPKSSVYHSHDYNLKSLFKRRYNDGMAFSNICLEGESEFFYKGLSYFFAEMKYILKNKSLLMPYAIIYDFLYLIGFQLGTKDHFLPRFIKILLKNTG